MTKLHVLSDAVTAWLALTVDELSLELANASLTPSKSRFADENAVLRHLANTAYARGHADAIYEQFEPPESRRRLTPLEEAEQKVLTAPETEIQEQLDRDVFQKALRAE